MINGNFSDEQLQAFFLRAIELFAYIRDTPELQEIDRQLRTLGEQLLEAMRNEDEETVDSCTSEAVELLFYAQQMRQQRPE